MSYLHALKRGDEAEAKRLLGIFLLLEAIRVLHTAVSLSGVVDMGPILPLLTEADPATHGEIKGAAKALLAAEMTARQQAAAA